MLNFKAVKQTTSNDNQGIENTRRRYPRRAHDVCMINVDGQPYPVSDWSQCGVLFEADTRPFSEGQTVNMILRFKIGNHIEDIKITGEVVRKNNHTVAVTYNETPQDVIESMNAIIRQSA